LHCLDTKPHNSDGAKIKLISDTKLVSYGKDLLEQGCNASMLCSTIKTSDCFPFDTKQTVQNQSESFNAHGPLRASRNYISLFKENTKKY
jgi:hypothetical protein